MKPKFKVGDEVYMIISKEFEEDTFVFVVCHEKFKVVQRNIIFTNLSNIFFFYSLAEVVCSKRVDSGEYLMFKSYSEAFEECERLNKELLKKD